MIGLMKPNAKGESIIYLTSSLPANGAIFYVLSPVKKSVRCCLKVSSTQLPTDFESNFLSSPDASKRPDEAQHAYVSAPSEGLGVDLNELQIVVNATSAKIEHGDYKVRDGNGRSYTVESCFGTEGINLYLRDDRTEELLNHYYGYLNYDIEGNCSVPKSSPRK